MAHSNAVDRGAIGKPGGSPGKDAALVEGLSDIVAAACRGVDGLQAAIVFGSALTSDTPGDVIRRWSGARR
ncbi:MAG: hypothetical protein IPI67_42375 [Myxococcales bacterium]|nr:hypothetical protein [Myxococcales bacterium]